MKIKPKLKNLDRIATRLARTEREKTRQSVARGLRFVKSLIGRGESGNLGYCITGKNC